MSDRKEFEKWVKNPHMLSRRIEPGYEHEYEHPWTAGAWASWQELQKRVSDLEADIDGLTAAVNSLSEDNFALQQSRE